MGGIWKTNCTDFERGRRWGRSEAGCVSELHETPAENEDSSENDR
jgi:hypothetical protein